MRTRQVILISVLSSVVTLAAIGVFLLSASPAIAQPLNLVTGEGESATPTPQAPNSLNGDGSGPANLPADAPLDLKPESVQSPLDETLSYYYILGSHLLPRMSATTHVYSGNGCIYVTANGGDLRLQFPVLLEEGAVIKYLRLEYRDSSEAFDVKVWLTGYIPGQSSFDITSVSSSGSAGLGSVVSPELSYIVDSDTYQYSLNVDWGALNNSTQICGIRVAYYPVSPFALALPFVTRPAAP